MILTDTFIIEKAELITEDRNGNKKKILKGIFGRCDEKNNNGRVYSKKILNREIERLAEAMGERRLLGELDHPQHDAVKLSNVSHLITSLQFKNNELFGECELLNTPAGQVAQALVEGGVKVGISSRGMGTLTQDLDGTKLVNEDYKLVTFDLVADPSTRGAFPGLSESKQNKKVNEIVRTTLNQAAQEKVFVTLLKEKLQVGSQKADYTEVKVPKGPPTKKEPFKNWEDYYGWNAGRPKVRQPRGYENFDKITEPDKVVESRYAYLKKVVSRIR